MLSVYLRLMKQSFFVYPGGFSGVALMFLRLSVASSLSNLVLQPFESHLWPTLGIAVLILGLTAGLYTRISACLAAAMFLAQLVLGSRMTPIALLADALAAAGLTMSGPGAFSLDALRFGRRTLHLPD